MPILLLLLVSFLLTCPFWVAAAAAAAPAYAALAPYLVFVFF